jgi:ribosomal-protein-alanine N-acetyltransferase
MTSGSRHALPGEPAAMTAGVAGAEQGDGGEAVIRPLLASDLPEVMAMEERSHPEPWTEGIMRDCMRAGYTARVLEAPDGAIIGYGLVTVAAGESHLLNLTIHPNHRGQGHGRVLLRALLAEARLAGAEMAILEVRP